MTEEEADEALKEIAAKKFFTSHPFADCPDIVFFGDEPHLYEIFIVHRCAKLEALYENDFMAVTAESRSGHTHTLIFQGEAAYIKAKMVLPYMPLMWKERAKTKLFISLWESKHQ